MKSKFSLSILSLLFFSFTSLFLFMGIEPLNEEGLIALKQGKKFWEWNSPQGVVKGHYIEEGSGPNHLILIHGFRAHTYTWRYLMKPLADAGYHIWAIDLIGYGLSDKPETAPYDVHFFMKQMKAFMEAKGIPTAHVVGNSMGGGIALYFALEEPSLVNSVTVINALGYPLKLPLYIAFSRHFPSVWTPFLGPTMVRQVLRTIVYKTDRITNEQVEAYYLPYRLPGGINASLQTLKQYDNEKLFALCSRYSEIKHPLLIVWGEKDELIPLNHYKKFKRDFPNASTLLISDCGHIPQEEEPEQVLKAMIDFLK